MLDAGPNLLVYPNISESDRAKVRSNFQLDLNETILFVADNSFWATRNQGLVLTDLGITCIPNKNRLDEMFSFTWQQLDHAQYKELNIYFFDSEGNNIPIGINYFSFNNNVNYLAQKGRSLAAAFTEMAKSAEPEKDPIDEKDEVINRMLESEKSEQAIATIKDYINNDDGTYKAYWYYRMAEILSVIMRDSKKDEEAEWACLEGLKYCEEGSPISVWLHYLLYSTQTPHVIDVFNGDSSNYALIKEVRKESFHVTQIASDEKRSDGVLLVDDSKKDLDFFDEEYSKLFLSLPYNERKVLIPVKNYTDLSLEHITVLKMDRLPSEMDFPIGHPVANQVYVGHPFLPHKYIPFENYQLELIEDKVREFCQIAQCLGAIEITIDTENSSQSNGTRNYTQDINGTIEYKGVGVSGGRKRSGSRSLIEEISQAINLHQTFVPTKAPYLPKTTVWYQNEPSWQRLYEQRMNGGLTQHEERIETRKNQVVDNHELQEVKAELQSLFASANLNWNTSIDESFSQQENAVLSICVKLAPIESLSTNVQPSVNEEVDTDAVMNIVNKNKLFFREFTKNYDFCFFLLDKESYSDIEENVKSILETFPLEENEIPIYLCGYFYDENDENSESCWFLITNTSIYCDSYEEVFDWNQVTDITIKNHLLYLCFEDEGVSYKWELASEWLTGNPNAQLEQWESILLSFVKVYKGDTQEKKGNQTGITDSEQEYLEMVKDCLEDGEIGSRERKLLDKIRIKNGISEERAKELESTLTVTQLTNDEKEYLEMFHEYAEKGEITERERRRLDKFAQALGLTKKRIEELESN